MKSICCRGQLKCDGTRAETRFRPSARRMSPFKWAGSSVQSTTGSRSVRISGSNAGYTMLRGSVKGTGYSLHSPVSPSLPLPCVTVCYHISTGLPALFPVGYNETVIHWTCCCFPTMNVRKQQFESTVMFLWGLNFQAHIQLMWLLFQNTLNVEHVILYVSLCKQILAATFTQIYSLFLLIS